MPLSLFESDDRQIPTQTIKDGFGNLITLPKWGCCSYAEVLAIDQEMDKVQSASEHKKNVVVAFLTLRLRDKLAANPELGGESLLSDRHGQPIPEPMVENLYQFAMAEYNRDAPRTQEMTITGKNAKAVACAYAKKHKSAVISRTDLELQNIYYVFSSTDAIATMNQDKSPQQQYQIIESHCAVEKPEGKSIEPPTGTEST